MAARTTQGKARAPQKRWTEAIGRQLVEIVAETGSVSRACRELDIRGKWTVVWKWDKAGKTVDGVPLGEAVDNARRQYCSMVQDKYVEVLEELDYAVVGSKSDTANVSKLRAKAQGYQWLLSKLLPRLYGDKVEHTGNVEHGITVQMVSYGGGEIAATPSIGNDSRAHRPAPLVIDSTHEESTT